MRFSNRRNDKVKAAVVNKGVQLQERVGTVLAAQFLKNNNVDIAVVLRVLNRPKGRRNYA